MGSSSRPQPGYRQAQLLKTVTGLPSGHGQKTRRGESGDGIGFQEIRVPVLPQDEIHPDKIPAPQNFIHRQGGGLHLPTILR